MAGQVAVLIDGDNVSSKYAEYIKQEASNYGNVKIMRLYGSITSPSVKAWYVAMPLQGIVPMLQISYANGKSVADQALTIDAMDLLYTKDIDTFCIVSSDSDFTKLVYRLKEAGKVVIGMGESKTREALAKSCDEFKILDLIYKEAAIVENYDNKDRLENNTNIIVEDNQVTSAEGSEGTIEESEINVPTEDEIVSYIYEFIEKYDDDKVNLSEVGKALRQRFLGFDARNYDYNNITKMVENHEDKFDVYKEKAPDGIHIVIYVSAK